MGVAGAGSMSMGVAGKKNRVIKFRDERKFTVGMASKELLKAKSKDKKSVFNNCFALVLRIWDGERTRRFYEVHVKVFKTGKMEIPGKMEDALFVQAKRELRNLFADLLSLPDLEYVHVEDDNVLINSNFNCGFFINRSALNRILRGPKYRIDSSYDPNHYPGVKCRFFFRNAWGLDPVRQTGAVSAEHRQLKMKELQHCQEYTKVSFMIFRTGGGLVVGKCSQEILEFVYAFVKRVLFNEYFSIYMDRDDLSEPLPPEPSSSVTVASGGLVQSQRGPRDEGRSHNAKKTKVHRRKIFVDVDYWQTVISCT